MRKNLMVLASAALVITTAATAATLQGHPVRTTSPVTTLDPSTMHYGTMPVQEMSDLTFVFTQ